LLSKREILHNKNSCKRVHLRGCILCSPSESRWYFKLIAVIKIWIIISADLSSYVICELDKSIHRHCAEVITPRWYKEIQLKSKPFRLAILLTRMGLEYYTYIRFVCAWYSDAVSTSHHSWRLVIIFAC
jgi:hypothetical protein